MAHISGFAVEPFTTGSAIPLGEGDHHAVRLDGPAFTQGSRCEIAVEPSLCAAKVCPRKRAYEAD
jgi:hypothetical protein